MTISACSNTATSTATDSDADSTAKSTATQTATFDTENPTSYAEYKRWRKAHAPSSEAYADYKQWEIAYRRWKAQQEQ